MAARTSWIELVAGLTAVVYREPGTLAKLVSTVDVSPPSAPRTND